MSDREPGPGSEAEAAHATAIAATPSNRPSRFRLKEALQCHWHGTGGGRTQVGTLVSDERGLRYFERAVFTISWTASITASGRSIISMCEERSTSRSSPSVERAAT